MRYAVFHAFIYMINMTSLSYFFLFHFILELLRIFMVMINIVIIELIIATENYLLNIFLLEIVLSKLIILYSSHSHLVKVKWFKFSMDRHIV